MSCTIRVAKTKTLISFAVTAKLICAFVFAYADCSFSHAAAHIIILGAKVKHQQLNGLIMEMLIPSPNRDAIFRAIKLNTLKSNEPAIEKHVLYRCKMKATYHFCGNCVYIIVGWIFSTIYSHWKVHWLIRTGKATKSCILSCQIENHEEWLSYGTAEIISRESIVIKLIPQTNYYVL